MAEFVHTEETVIKEREPVIFENLTDSDFSVSAGIVFRESGLYRVIVDDGRITVSKEPERKKGKWIFETGPKPRHMYCSECGARYIPSDEWEMWKGNCDHDYELPRNFCSQCGADMRKEHEE